MDIGVSDCQVYIAYSPLDLSNSRTVVMPGTNVGPVQITPSQSNKNVSNLSKSVAYSSAVFSR